MGKTVVLFTALLFSASFVIAQTELHDAKITGNISLGNQEITAIQDLETDCIYKSEPHSKGLFIKDEQVKLEFKADKEQAEVIKPTLPEVVLVHKNGCKENVYGNPTKNVKSEPIYKEDDVLVFENWSIFMETMDSFSELEEKLIEKNSNDDKLNESGSPILTAFEKKYKHESLRLDIINRENEAFKNGTWSETNDPDNHFIADPYLRTVLNKNLEVKVGQEYFKYIDESKYIRITNGSKSILQDIRNNPDAICGRPFVKTEYIRQPMYGLTCNGNPIVVGNPLFGPACGDFNIKYMGEDLNEVELKLWYTGGGQQSVTYIVTLLDGGTLIYNIEDDFGYATIKLDPNTAYEITATVNGGNCNGTIRKTIFKANCPTAIFNIQEDGLSVDISNNSLHKGVEIPQWNFGDNTIEYSNADFINHTYTTTGEYTITLKYEATPGCTESISTGKINIFTPFVLSDCCSRSDRVMEKHTAYDGGTRAMKAVLYTVNFFFYHKAGMKTKNYENKNGWKLDKADEISHYFDGSIYLKNTNKDECRQKKAVTEGETKTKDRQIFHQLGVGEQIWLRYQSLKSTHFVKVGTKTETIKLTLTNDTKYDNDCVE